MQQLQMHVLVSKVDRIIRAFRKPPTFGELMFDFLRLCHLIVISVGDKEFFRERR